HPYLHSFPTRRSSDLLPYVVVLTLLIGIEIENLLGELRRLLLMLRVRLRRDVAVKLARLLDALVLAEPEDMESNHCLAEQLDQRSEEHTSELQSRGHL